MKAFSFLPYFNRSQRRGLILLLLIIVALQVVIFYSNNLFKQEVSQRAIPKDLQQQYDSLKQVALKNRQPKIYPFYPNYLTDYKAYYLGLTLPQTDKVLAFIQSGQTFKSKAQFKEVSGISDSLFAVLEPYIKISSYKKFNQNNFKSRQVSTTDINLATAQDLQTINGIGSVLSARIVKYRNAIGGFTDKSQLNKVYGLEADVINRLWQRFKLKTKTTKTAKHIIKKEINTANTEDLKQVYGIGDKLAERIVKYRQKIGGFTIKQQLNDVYGLSPEVIDQLWQHFDLLQPTPIAFKIELNEANIKELAKNPYISYQLAKKIVSYRTLNGAFHTFDALLKIPDYPRDIHKQICLYLKL